MTNLATKLFGPPEEIVVGKSSLAHLYRWTIFGMNHFSVCLQHTVGDDTNNEFRNNPKHFVSFGVARNLYASEHQFPEVILDRAAWMIVIGRDLESTKDRPYD